MPPVAEVPMADVGGSELTNPDMGEEKKLEDDALTKECDFDKDPTHLYLNLQKREWDSAVQRANGFQDEARTWVSRKEKDGKLRWRLLPLHAAIIFKAPEHVIEALLGAYPNGAECKDDQGMLPLHLAFRNGSTEGIVNLLLVAYPQSIDVKDRKGRIPLVLAQASTSPNRDAFMRALERGPTYYAVAAAATERAAVTAELRAIFDAKLIEIRNQHQHQVETLKKDSESIKIELEDKVQELESELAKTQETSQVLVDHVNSLEAQLSSRSDTERFLATKIATLDASLRDVTVKKEETEDSLTTENVALNNRVAELENRLLSYQEDNTSASSKLNGATSRIAVLEGEHSKLERDSSATISKLEMDLANSRANGAILEAQLKKKIETEHALASQVSTLAARLAESAAESSTSTSSYSARITILEQERETLRATVAQLTMKLKNVALALDTISLEQDKIVQAAAMHEDTMAKASAAHAKIVAEATKQDEVFIKGDKERGEILAILDRQRADMEASVMERQALRQAILVQDEQMNTTTEERDALIQGVRRQKESVAHLVAHELAIIPTEVGEDEDLVDEIVKSVRAQSVAACMSEEDSTFEFANDATTVGSQQPETILEAPTEEEEEASQQQSVQDQFVEVSAVDYSEEVSAAVSAEVASAIGEQDDAATRVSEATTDGGVEVTHNTSVVAPSFDEKGSMSSNKVNAPDDESQN